MTRSIATGALAAIVLITLGCEKKQQQPAAAQHAAASVIAATAAAQDVPVYIDEIGKTAARESVTIQPQVTGKITEIHFTDGADVKKGALLFTIDARPFEAILAQAEASVAQSEANVKWS